MDSFLNSQLFIDSTGEECDPKVSPYLQLTIVPARDSNSNWGGTEGRTTEGSGCAQNKR